MSNTLTGLIPTIYAALGIVSREQIGFIPNVQRDSSTAGAAVGQTVRSPVVPAAELEDITPGANPADSGDQTIGYTDVTISKSKAYPIRWSGEEQLSTTKDGVVNTILQQQFEQGFRTIANAVEADLGSLYKSCARAYGTAGTTPFGTAEDMTDLAEMNRILDDNGAPASGRVCILGSAARAKLEGKQSQLFKANEAGTDGLLRSRDQRQLHGFTMGYSAGVQNHVKGTGAAYDVDLLAGYAVGDTTVHVDTGTGTILAGDVVTFAGDANKYIIGTGFAGDGDGDIILNDPGLRAALADGADVSVGNNYTANMAFSSDAFVLAARAPAMPEGGDAADDVISVVDPVSGLAFQVAMYREYRRIKYEIGLAWGVGAPNGRHSAVLLG